jgi:hypothetical protein
MRIGWPWLDYGTSYSDDSSGYIGIAGWGGRAAYRARGGNQALHWGAGVCTMCSLDTVFSPLSVSCLLIRSTSMLAQVDEAAPPIDDGGKESGVRACS